MKTVGQLRREKGLNVPKQRDSEYKVCQLSCLLGDSNQEIKYGFCNLFLKHLKYLTAVRHKTKHLYGNARLQNNFKHILNTFHSVLILGGF